MGNGITMPLRNSIMAINLVYFLLCLALSYHQCLSKKISRRILMTSVSPPSFINAKNIYFRFSIVKCIEQFDAWYNFDVCQDDWNYQQEESKIK